MKVFGEKKVKILVVRNEMEREKRFLISKTHEDKDGKVSWPSLFDRWFVMTFNEDIASFYRTIKTEFHGKNQRNQ